MNDTPEQPTDKPSDPAPGAARGLSLEEILRGRAGEIVLSKPGEELVRISAYTARQKAGAYAGMEISVLLYPGQPFLVHSEGRLVWRVPLALTLAGRGNVGWVGALDVDAHTARVYASPARIQEITANAQSVAQGSPHPAAV